MIKYNCAYRGALKYDKYALNILELQNNVNILKNNSINNKIITNKTLKQLKNKFDNLYCSIVDNSLSEQLFIVQQYLK